MIVGILDSGVANFASVIAAFTRLGVEVCVTTDRPMLERATHLVLPGVGSAEPAMRSLHAAGLVEFVRHVRKPLLGICLGMQLLFEHSEEGSGVDCLGVLQGRVTTLQASSEAPVPHMGWNSLEVVQPSHPLLAGVPHGSRAYFVHSYAAIIPKDHAQTATLATTTHGSSLIPAMVGHGFYMGCQFHPERSGAIGAKILENFLAIDHEAC